MDKKNLEINEFVKPGKENQRALALDEKNSENFKDMPVLGKTFLERRKNKDLSLSSFSSSLTGEEINDIPDSESILMKTLDMYSPNGNNMNESKYYRETIPFYKSQKDTKELDKNCILTHGDGSFNFETFMTSATSNISKYDWRTYLRDIREKVRDIESTVEKNESAHTDDLHSKEMRMVDGQYIAEKDISYHAVEYDITLNQLNSDISKLYSQRKNIQGILDAARMKNISHYKDHNVKLPSSEEFINQKFEMKKKLYRLIEKDRILSLSSNDKDLDTTSEIGDESKNEIWKEKDLIYDGSDLDLQKMWRKSLSKYSRTSRSDVRVTDTEEITLNSLKGFPFNENMLEDYVSRYLKEKVNSNSSDKGKIDPHIALDEYHKEIEQILKSRDRNCEFQKKEEKTSASKVKVKSQRSKSIINKNFKRK